LTDDPYADQATATAAAAQDAPSGDTVTLRTVYPVTSFNVPDEGITITHYGTKVASDKADIVRAAGVAAKTQIVVVPDEGE
jgi:hypothetical protein